MPGSSRFWRKEHKPRQASLTLEEHFLRYIHTTEGLCTKRKIRNYIYQGLDIQAYPFLVHAIHANCSKRVIELLLDLGADPYMEDFYMTGNNAMVAAIRTQRPDIVAIFVKYDVDINKITGAGQSPFHITCLQGNTIILQYLLANGGNVHICDQNLNTPLHLAVKANHHDIAGILLNHGANPNAMNITMNTPLFSTNSIQLAELLLVHGADVNHRNINGDTPLHRLVKHKSTKLVKLLLDHHANPLLSNNQGRNAIDIAKYHENNKIDENSNMSGVLLQYSAEVKLKYHRLIYEILVNKQQETGLQNTIFDYIF